MPLKHYLCSRKVHSLVPEMILAIECFKLCTLYLCWFCFVLFCFVFLLEDLLIHSAHALVALPPEQTRV